MTHHVIPRSFWKWNMEISINGLLMPAILHTEKEEDIFRIRNSKVPFVFPVSKMLIKFKRKMDGRL